MAALVDTLERRRADTSPGLTAADTELVLVFETRGSVRQGLLSAISAAGLELLLEVEDEFDPDDDFQRSSGGAGRLNGFLHVAMADAAAVSRLLQLWTTWSNSGSLPYGYGALASVFDHLADVHPWGASDRVRDTGLQAVLEDLAQEPDSQIAVQLELWYSGSAQKRSRAEDAVRAQVNDLGGEVVARAELAEIGYLALAAVLPASGLLAMLDQGPEAVRLLRSDELLFVRPGGQAVVALAGEDASAQSKNGPLPSGEPTVAVLDGLPVQNHQRLTDRIQVFDPDSIEGPEYLAELRLHGTQMASLVIWGDFALDEPALARPVLVRPILRPDPTRRNQECFPDDVLIPDLMERAFHELFGDADRLGIAPSVRIVSLSVGDPHGRFAVLPSSWALALDWLSEKYGVLVIVSAGNHPVLDIPMGRAEFEGLATEDRRQLALDTLRSLSADRRLLSPAESINAITVGALHNDGFGPGPLPVGASVVDILGGAVLPSPISAIGSGVRRSVKPDLLAPGGRQLFSTDVGRTDTRLLPVRAPLGPGILAASPRSGDPTSGEVHIHGTSAAAALVSRRAAEIYDRILELQASGAGILRRHEAPALKSLLAHGASWASLESLPGFSRAERSQFIAYGAISSNLAHGCPSHRVTVLTVGDLGAREECDVRIPLPPSLSAIRGKRRVTGTLAWLSPTNWQHRQYRQAKLAFGKPAGMPVPPSASGSEIGFWASQRGTVQQQAYEGVQAVPVGPTDFVTFTVKCSEQAGGLQGQSVPFGLAVSIEVAPELGVAVYSEVAARLQTAVQVPIAPRPGS